MEEVVTMQMSTNQRIALSVAHSFVRRYAETFPTKKAHELAVAHCGGRIEVAAIALGYMTPGELELLLLDSCRALGPYPSYEPSKNEAQKAYVAALVNAVVEKKVPAPEAAQ